MPPGRRRESREAAPRALKEAEEVKGSNRRPIIAAAVLLVVGVGSLVLFAQAMAGEGVGFHIMRAMAYTGSGGAVLVPTNDQDDSRGMGAAAVSCGMNGASCTGHEGGASCHMTKADGSDPDGASFSMAPAETKDGASAAVATCTADEQGDCSSCDQKATCPIHQAQQATEQPSAAEAN
jgi:hypothetical protein